MTNQAQAIESGKWWYHFVNGDLEAVRGCLAPDVVRIGPRSRDSNHIMQGREEYIEYMRGLLATMPRLNESVLHEIVASPDGKTVYLHITERDSTVPNSTEDIIDVTCLILCNVNADGLISKIDIYWKQPEIDYEWTGTEASQ